MRLVTRLALLLAGQLLAVLACGPVATPTPSAVVPPPTDPPVVSTFPVIPSDTPSPGEISGLIWKDRCLLTGGEGGEPLVLGQGCVSTGPNPWEWGADQVFEPPFESGLAGVTVRLGPGMCPSTGLASSVTDAAGTYAFPGLAPGAYCVSFDPLLDGNDSVLIPGGLSYPIRGGTPATDVAVSGGGLEVVDFGWTFQFGD